MLQQDEPEDFVIATGEVRSVRQFVEATFKEVRTRLLLLVLGSVSTNLDRFDRI